MDKLSIHIVNDALLFIGHGNGCTYFNNSYYSCSTIIDALHKKDKPLIKQLIDRIISDAYFSSLNASYESIYKNKRMLMSCSLNAREKVNLSSIFIDDNVVRTVIIRMILQFLGSPPVPNVDVSFTNLTGVDDTCSWVQYCKDNYNLEWIEYNDLPTYIKILIDYCGPTTCHQYRIYDYCLISRDSLIVNSPGLAYNVIINKSIILDSSNLCYSLISNSSLTKSYTTDSLFINSSIVLSTGRSLESINSSFMNSNSSSSVINNCNVNSSKINDSDITNFKLSLGSINYSVLYSGNRNLLFYRNWSVNSRVINTNKSILFFAKTFRKNRLSIKTYEYDNKDSASLKRQGNGNFVSGIELEVITDYDVIVYKPSYCRVKSDGSLSPGGLEIVTRPDSEDSHVHNLNRLLRINNLKIDSTCGMHVHVPKSIGKYEIIKNRIYKNKRRYFRIAGRAENRYCLYDENADRYQAVGRTRHGTIEFRLFSSTLNVHKIKRRLKWVKEMCKWSMKQKDEEIEINPFMNFNIRNVHFNWASDAAMEMI